MGRFIGLLGIAFLLSVAYLFSSNQAAIRWRTVMWGITLQLVFALLILKVEVGRRTLTVIAGIVTRFIGFADEGSSFVFGSLANDPEFFIFAFKVLPIVIFISSFFWGLYTKVAKCLDPNATFL